MSILEPLTLLARLAPVVEQARTGNVGAGARFATLLHDFDLVPPVYKKVAWINLLVHYAPPSSGSDLKRYGGPVLVNAMLALLRGDEVTATQIASDIDDAIAEARAARADRRRTLSSVVPHATNSRSLSPLHEHLDNALSLLEGAATSNNLLARHRTRLLRLVDTVAHDRAAGQSPSLKTPDPRDRGDPKTQGNDATRGWGRAFRDSGSFGSHAAYDAMDDESSP